MLPVTRFGTLPVVATLPNTTDLLTDLERAAWGGYLRSHAAMVRQLDATLIEAHGLPLSSFEVLARLAQQDEGKQRMSDLRSRSGSAVAASRVWSTGSSGTAWSSVAHATPTPAVPSR